MRTSIHSYKPTAAVVGSLFTDNSSLTAARFSFSAKERDAETGLSYFGARYYSSDLSIWLSVDPMSDKYPSLSPYVYCADNPVRCVDPDGEDWYDSNGNPITDHSKIKVYIFYVPKSFGSQSKAMCKAAEQKYGKGSVAMSNVITTDEFAKDWGDMASNDIKEVNLNYHGNNQTLMLNSANDEFITSTGNGKTSKSEKPAKNVQDLPIPKGNIFQAQLNLNSCKSNSSTQYPLKGTRQTLMVAFYNTFNFKIVRGSSFGVSYNRFSHQPEPQYFWQYWDYMGEKPHNSSFNFTESIYYNSGGMR